MIKILTIDPGLNHWGAALKDIDGKVSFISLINKGETPNAKMRHFAWGLKRYLYNEVWEGGFHFGIEGTWQAPQSAKRGAPPATVALINQIIGIAKAWTWTIDSNIIIHDIPVWAKKGSEERPWMEAYSLARGPGTQYQREKAWESACVSMAESVLGIKPDSVHSACALLMLDWLERRI